MLSTLRTDNSPFNEQQLKQLNISIGDLSSAQSQWLSGYLAGHLMNSAQSGHVSQSLPQSETLLNIIYASETGNGEALANLLASKAKQQGINAELVSLDNFRPASLRKLKNVAFVMSTHGEGDPPDEAIELFEYLASERAAKLPELNYRVLALGDRSYQYFCEAGRKLDELLQQLGAQAFGQRLECDVDYSASANTWNDEVLDYVRENLLKDTQSPILPHLSVVPDKPRWSRQQPFSAQLERVQKITALQSDKDVYHLELSLEDSGIQYQPGDALGVWAPNDPELVALILDRLVIKPTESVRLNEQEMTISEALTQHREITRLTSETVLSYASNGSQSSLKALFTGLEPRAQREFIEQRQFIDLADEYPALIASQVLVDLLRPLGPRSYSIASSQQLVDEEVHLTVASYNSDAIGITRHGVASQFLNHRLKAGDPLHVFLEPNRRFRLPQDPQTPIIMIAAGTGIAPFRAFMQELESTVSSANESPDSWLIFGNPHLRSDFLYQKEWLHWRESGLLNQIDTAWSRDQEDKFYVQDVLQQQAVQIDDWLQRGAHIYLCGSLQMGQSVLQTLQTTLAEQRGLGPQAAADVMTNLRREHRIQKDLY